MKTALALSTLLAILALACAFLTGSTINSSTGAKVCVLRNCSLNATTNACGRYGSSNLCTRFRNSCALRYQSCVSSTTYTAVALSRCSSISLNSRGICGGSSSTSSSTSNVVPIIIRRG
ncbi:uncharacterized protein DMAD_03920 [Drosophila madeirensis]|uniref:Uncharacterized protein n=1 Tax=Drosophila madeirensis TaxID=30013 RepID=A0AAU9GC62_DROMD|nr:uncharacterized protein LOC117890867 [Drosophila subobscura]